MEHGFALTITGAERGDWHGCIQEENAPGMEFQSLLEPVKIIN